jgi:hypothetical protein
MTADRPKSQAPLATGTVRLQMMAEDRDPKPLYCDYGSELDYSRGIV